MKTHTTADRGGAVTSIVCYWLAKLAAEMDGVDEFKVPEFGEGSILEPLQGCLNGAELSSGYAFELGVTLAGIAAHDPLGDLGPAFRTAIARAIAETAELETEEAVA